jgi:PAS domain S-box-containing protein
MKVWTATTPMLGSSKSKIMHTGLLLIAMPMLIFVACLSALFYVTDLEVQQLRRAEQDRAIAETANQLARIRLHAERSLQAFMYSRHVALLEDFDQDARQAQALIEQLLPLTSSKSAEERSAAEALQQTQAEFFKVLNALAVSKNEPARAHRTIVAQRKSNELKDAVQRLLDIHRQSQQPTAPLAHQLYTAKVIIGAIALLNCIGSGVAAALFMQSLKSRVTQLAENSTKLVSGEKLQEPLSGDDELAQLDKVFHEMSRTLAAAARRERAILDNAVDVICSLNKQLEFTAVSPSVEKAWQYERYELIAASFLASKNQGDKKLESCMVTKSGGSSYVSWSVHWSPEEQTFFCVGHDITDRKRAEELLRESESRIRLIIESMPVGLLIVDSNGYIEMTNIQADHMFGYRYEDLLGEHISKIFDGEFLGPAALRKYMGKLSDVEGKRKDGANLPLQVTLTEFTLHGAKKILVASLDVSERQAVEQLKKQLIATVSHDLRTPLTMIQNTLAVLSADAVGKLDTRGKELVGSAETEAQRLIEMINSLLDIEKMQSGKLQMEMQPVLLDSIISRSVTVVSHAAEKQHVELDAAPSGCEVMADGAKLVQVMVNLLANAIKFSPKNSKVTIRCEEDEGWLQIKVSDEGRGIPSQQKDMVFESFYQVEDGDRTEKGGTGLGLAICKTIVEAHGGLIGVQSEEGIGSTFWFKIPAVD